MGWEGLAIETGSPKILDLLASSELFQALEPQVLEVCASRFIKVVHDKGAVLFSRGDPGDCLYLVAEGQVRFAISTLEGRELSFEIAGAGDVFGEIAVLDGSSRSAEALALTRTTAYTLGRAEFLRLRREHPALSDAVIIFLCRRLRALSDKLESVALYPMHVRLARFLLSALGERTAPPGRRVPLELPFSQSELALLLGASRPKINAALGVLESLGAVGRTADRLFCDRDALLRLAQREEGSDAS